ncbi:MAG: protein kinase domain-containing protein, partial [Thermoguttaceae bacterium]
MEHSVFYNSARIAGLVAKKQLDAALNRLAEIDAGSRSADHSTEPPVMRKCVDLQQLQRVANLHCGVGHHIIPFTTHENSGTLDSFEASLDGDASEKKVEATDLDRRLSEEIIRQGFLNRWQARQLLNGRTKFTLGQYWILDAIGKGGYGHVFLGREDRAAKKKAKMVSAEKSENDAHRLESLEEENYVAVKVLPLTKSAQEQIDRFLHEIDIHRNLSHPNLLQYINSGRDGNVHFMVHEFIDGGDLRS